jgi:hypothetical protein
MKKRLLLSAFLAALCAATHPVHAENDPFGDNGDKVTTLAVFGDWAYNQLLLDNAPRLVDGVNADRAIDLVLHIGDIHSGSMPCTSAGILPPIPASNPGWNELIFSQFQKFKTPVVYTPGDNEWTDCHKKKQLFSGAPLNELAAVRRLFFSRPGHTLGLTDKVVYSQSKYFDPHYPVDAKFVENVIWRDGKTVFVTVNMPGSNNDGLPWSAPFTDEAARLNEVYERSNANIRWLQAAFAYAGQSHAKAVVIGLQADMWDPAALPTATPTPGDGLSGYTPFVQELANQTVWFGKPVLLINGDSHVYNGGDHPLADRSSDTGRIHNTQPVPNLTRITVQGSTSAPAEWLRLTIDTRTSQVFSWRNVPYCSDPLSSCN